MRKVKRENPIPIWERELLTIEEATAYTGIGIRKLRDMTNEPDCEYIIWIGPKKMINRRKLDRYLDVAKTV